MPVPNYLDYCFIVVSIESSYFIPFFFFSRIVLVILGPLLFYMNFRISFPVYVKMAAGLLIGIALNLEVNMVNIVNNMIYVGFDFIKKYFIVLRV